MKLDEKLYFCSCCTRDNLTEHVVMVDDDEACVFCGYYAILRKVTEKDLRWHKKNKEKLKKAKLEAIGLIAREKEYNEKIN